MKVLKTNEKSYALTLMVSYPAAFHAEEKYFKLSNCQSMVFITRYSHQRNFKNLNIIYCMQFLPRLRKGHTV